MTGDEMERAIEFLLEHHAKFSVDMDKLQEIQAQTSKDIIALAEMQAQTSKDIMALAEAQARTSRDVESLAESVVRLEAQAETDRQEIREAIDNLIVANEVTRKLAEDVARLAVQTAHRVTDIESRLS